jgi:hypothetical protein
MAERRSRRRYPRLFLDVDWFVESDGCSTLGRGLEISPRGALLPVTCIGRISSSVTLHVSLPARSKMFKAKGQASNRRERGWAIIFKHVSHEDLHLLAMELIAEHGLDAIPALERKYSKFIQFEDPAERDSISEGVPR